ncbi:MAG: PASTA domain-containing protein [Bacteroidetes bacterium]|nr:PASTA domain-containing protein [Bacteroidota bacterium]
MEFVRFLFSKRFLKHFLISIGITAFLLWVTFYSLSWYTKHSDYIVVPDFRGQNISDIMHADRSGDFKFAINDSIFDPDKPKGSILSQDPYPGSRVKHNRMVYLTIVSIIPEKTAMPDLKDLTLRQAQSMLESSGLKLGKLIFIKSFDEDAVQNQLLDNKVIAPGTKLEKGSVIDLQVGMGAKASQMKKDTNQMDSLLTK